ncbi:hypothetical protein ACFQWH_26685 [Mycolicibacterium sp. GCM10028919]|uniref:hypothetical protein n=1 Tax=Mycolicibacterium sp. GCM10028919 TaxID=3273401 RepID=UPI0036233D27
MALRPFITAGVAFAAAGAVAATVAIAPPMSPGEVKVAQKTEVDLNANLTDLINTYFREFPGNPDNAGTIHAAGVIQQLLQNANVNDPRGTAVIDSYFEEGLSDVVRLLLTRDNVDEVSRDQINLFFNEGLSEVARYRLLMYQADPTLQRQINTFFGDSVNADGSENIAQVGFQGLFYDALVGTGLSADQRRLLDTFFNAPTALNSQAVPVFQPKLGPDGKPLFDADGNPVYVQAVKDGVPVVDANGNPVYVITGYVGNPNPARRGSFGVIYNTIRNTGLSPDQQATLDQFWDGGTTEVVRQRLLSSTGDQGQRDTINQYFDGGIDEVIRVRLVDGAADERSKDLWNEFFDNGVTGVVRYLLTGPVPEVESPPVPPTTPPVVTTLVAGVAESTTADTQLAAAVEENQEPAEQVAPQARKVEAAPVAAPAPAPATAPVESTSAVKQEAVSEVEEEDAEVKDGNKVEPVIIIPGGGGSSDGVRGGGAWGVFKPAFAAVDSMIKGSKPSAGGGATTGGTTDGGTTDGADNDGGGGGE